MIRTSKKRIEDILAYVEEHGDEEALRIFDITGDTLSRYKRRYKNTFNEKDFNRKGIISKIEERYTEKELKALAEGGRIVPGQDKVPVVDFEGEHIKFGYLTDSHLGSIFACPEWVEQAFGVFRKEGCEFVVNSGDVTEGMSNRDGHVYELSHIGYDKQREHAIEVYSAWRGKIYFIDGNHDRWFIKSNGAIIVKDICEQLEDAEFLGHDEGDISLKGKATLKLWHGLDSSSYAVSYRLQKIIESFTGGEKPSVLLTGHTHKMGYFFDRHVHVVSGGAICKQSTWMRGKRLANHSGFWIIDLWVGKQGVSKFQPTWYPFYA